MISENSFFIPFNWSLPPAPIVADCLLVIGLVFGINMRMNDLLVADQIFRGELTSYPFADIKLDHPVTATKSSSRSTGYMRNSFLTFRNPIHTTNEIDSAC